MYSIEHFENSISMQDYISNYLDIEKFKKCCEECPDYGKTWSCRPFDFDVIEYLKKYDVIDFYVKKINYKDNTNLDEALQILFKEKEKWAEELLDIEKNAKYIDKKVLLAGKCRVCEKCQRLIDKPCIHKDKCRYSIEALGGDTSKVLKDIFNIEILWAKGKIAPPYFVLLGALVHKI